MILLIIFFIAFALVPLIWEKLKVWVSCVLYQIPFCKSKGRICPYIFHELAYKPSNVRNMKVLYLFDFTRSLFHNKVAYYYLIPNIYYHNFLSPNLHDSLFVYIIPLKHIRRLFLHQIKHDPIRTLFRDTPAWWFAVSTPLFIFI